MFSEEKHVSTYSKIDLDHILSEQVHVLLNL